MSLTSKELNYLVWRYLSESGHELAAFALNKSSQCQNYDNIDVLERIKPGCLVELVQKGILYSLTEESLGKKPEDAKLGSALSLFGSLLESEKEAIQVEKQTTQSMREDSMVEDDGVDSRQDAVNESNNNKIGFKELNQDFRTKIIIPNTFFNSSIASDWHPKSDVFAYGTNDATAVIVALSNHEIAESVTLTHPIIMDSAKEINIVSWAPAGNIIVTSSINGDLRAWSPDGKLRNVSSTGLAEETAEAAMINSVAWSSSGSHLLSIDANNQVTLWDGFTLSMVQQVAPASTGQPLVACWLDDHRFALSSNKNSIKIIAVSSGTPNSCKTIGLLAGHSHPISLLKFNHESKLLASCSDFDYSIKIWQGNQHQHMPELLGHQAPIITLDWIDGGHLLSVSMDGLINLWDVNESKPKRQTSISSSENFKFSDAKKIVKLGSKVFNAAVSPDRRWLVLGDNMGIVSVWDIKLNFKCVGVYKANFEGPDSGICDITWSKDAKVCINFKGTDSVVFEWV